MNIKEVVPPTYLTGMVQAKANRILQNNISEILKNGYGLTASQWAIIGLIHDNKSINSSILSEELQVKPSHITELVDGLLKLEMLSRKSNPLDKREKILVLTDKGSKLVLEIEQKVRDRMRFLISGVSRDELGIYLKVLNTIVLNDKNLLNSPY